MTAFIFLIPFSLFSQFAGKLYITSNCASGGFDYYFFERKTVISVCSGCEAIPYIQYGSYEIKGDEIIVKMEEEWLGEGAGQILSASSINHYERYVAKYSIINEVFSIPLIHLKEGINEGCEEVKNHQYSVANPHNFLRNKLEGKYPETFQRLLTVEDLDGKSKQELRLMRNEIFARYGYIFSSIELNTYFNNQPGYVEFSKNVEAFLSEIEKNNVDLIKQFESK
jgi:hypothetical protein